MASLPPRRAVVKAAEAAVPALSAELILKFEHDLAALDATEESERDTHTVVQLRAQWTTAVYVSASEREISEHVAALIVLKRNPDGKDLKLYARIVAQELEAMRVTRLVLDRAFRRLRYVGDKYLPDMSEIYAAIKHAERYAGRARHLLGFNPRTRDYWGWLDASSRKGVRDPQLAVDYKAPTDDEEDYDE
jgi:hypothetical protein